MGPPLLTGITGAVLAGGQSRRMGRDKATLALDGEPLVARVVRGLRLALKDVIVIGPASLRALRPGALVIPDIRPGLGPVGGLLTALESAQTPWIFLAACDMPFIEQALVQRIVGLALASRDVDAVAFRSPGGLEPLCAAYHRDLLPLVADALNGPRPSMRGLLSEIRIREIPREEMTSLDPNSHSTFNTNTPEEWRRAEILAHDTGRDNG